MSFYELYENMVKNEAYRDARDAINNECYQGGYPGHREAAKNADNAAINCLEIIIKKEGRR